MMRWRLASLLPTPPLPPSLPPSLPRHLTPRHRPSPSTLSLRACSTHAGKHQTPIVDALWRRRETSRLSRPSPPPTERQDRRLEPRLPSHSATSVVYRFSHPDHAQLKDTYASPWGHVRPGRLLEDLDALAGTIAFEHCRTEGEPDLLLVTAVVERLVYRHRPNLQDDVKLAGAVSWVGKSSMEISMSACAAWTDEPFLCATFTFVARNPLTNRSAAINPLILPEGDAAAAQAFEMGRKRDEARKAARKRSKESALGLSIDAETTKAAAELVEAAQLLLTMPALADKRDILLSATRLQNALITMPQQRNTAGRVFGGFLMRRAYELAFATAYLFTGRRPVFIELDEVSFHAPVSVGDLLRFDSCVLYTSEAMDLEGRATVHVEVLANVTRPETRSSVTSNKFNFTFGVAANADGSGRAMLGKDVELRRVLPATHGEAYRIMERYKADIAQREEDQQLHYPKRGDVS